MNHTTPESPAATSSAFPESSHFACAEALHRLGGDTDLLHMLFSAFAADMPGRLERLEEALRLGSAEGMQRQAHAIKGSAAIIGARRCEELAAVLERQAGAAAGGHAEAATLAGAWNALRSEVLTVLVELEQCTTAFKGS